MRSVNFLRSYSCISMHRSVGCDLKLGLRSVSERNLSINRPALRRFQEVETFPWSVVGKA